MRVCAEIKHVHACVHGGKTRARTYSVVQSSQEIMRVCKEEVDVVYTPLPPLAAHALLVSSIYKHGVVFPCDMTETTFYVMLQ